MAEVAAVVDVVVVVARVHHRMPGELSGMA